MEGFKRSLTQDGLLPNPWSGTGAHHRQPSKKKRKSHRQTSKKRRKLAPVTPVTPVNLPMMNHYAYFEQALTALKMDITGLNRAAGLNREAVPGRKKRKTLAAIGPEMLDIDLEKRKDEPYFEIPGETIEGNTYKRVVIIGDYFVSRYNEVWPASSRIKPFFLYKDKLSIKEIFLKFKDHRFLKDCESILIIIMLSVHHFATYDSYKYPTCRADHEPIEFVKEIEYLKVEPKYMGILIDAMANVKAEFEANTSINVIFGYFPEYKFLQRLHESFRWSRVNVQNCVCTVNQMGNANCNNRYINIRSKKQLPLINRLIYNAKLNVLKEKVFEFYPLELTFERGHFLISSSIKDEKDVFALDACVAKLVFTDDTSFGGHIIEERIISKQRTDSVMTNMRKRLHGNNSDGCRIVIIGDNWLNFVLHEWNFLKQKWKPYFHCENFLTFDKICEIIKSLILQEEVGLIITHVPSGELFNMNSSSICKNSHKPMKYPVPMEELLDNPFEFGKRLMRKMIKFYDDIESCRKRCGVIFTTCYPALFAPYYDYLIKEHANKYQDHTNPNDLINKNPDYETTESECRDYEATVSECLEVVNKFVLSCNTSFGYTTVNISNMLKRASDEILFPLHSLLRGRKDTHGDLKRMTTNFQNYITELSTQCSTQDFVFMCKRDDKRILFQKAQARNKNALLFSRPPSTLDVGKTNIAGCSGNEHPNTKTMHGYGKKSTKLNQQQQQKNAHNALKRSFQNRLGNRSMPNEVAYENVSYQGQDSQYDQSQGLRKNQDNFKAVNSPRSFVPPPENYSNQVGFSQQQSTWNSPQSESTWNSLQRDYPQQNSTRNLQASFHSNDISTKTAQNNFRFPQNSTGNSEEGMLVRQNCYRNAPSHDRQLPARNPRSSYDDQHNIASNSFNFLGLEQTYPRNDEASHYSHQNFDRNREGNSPQSHTRQLPARNPQSAYDDQRNIASNSAHSYGLEQPYTSNDEPSHYSRQNFNSNPEGLSWGECSSFLRGIDYIQRNKNFGRNNK